MGSGLLGGSLPDVCTMTGKDLDLLAAMQGLSRAPAETDVSLRFRLVEWLPPLFNLPPIEYAPQVVEHLRKAFEVLETARQGGYFEKCILPGRSIEANAHYVAKAANALLDDPALIALSVTRRDSTNVELHPVWENWTIEPKEKP